MVARIVTGKCTGCRLCEQACPSVAIGMRPRLASEPGHGRSVAILEPEACYNTHACLEICQDNAIELAEPFAVGFDLEGTNSEAVKALCRKAGYGRTMQICVCTDTKAGDIAATIIAGAHSPRLFPLRTVRERAASSCA